MRTARSNAFPLAPRPLSLLAALWAALLVVCPVIAQESTVSRRPGRGGAQEVTVRAVPLWTQVYPGDQLPVAVVFQHQDGWHTWPAKTNPEVLPPEIAEFAIRTEIRPADATPPAWLQRVGPTQYPVPHPGLVANPEGGKPVEVPLYSGTAIAYVPVSVSASAPAGEQSLRLKIVFQSCDDKVCLPPQNMTVDVPVTVLSGTPAAGQARTVTDPGLFAGFDQRAFAADAPVAAVPGVAFNVFGWQFSVDPRGAAGLGALLALAAVGGLLLNFTPCVLPVIPIKILGLSQSAGSPARCLLLGGVMSVGVIAFWLSIGVAMAFISGFKAISTLFQTPWFSLGVGVFMLAMAASMLGAFLISLPNWVYAIDPSRESAKGAFGFGIMTAVLSTPCTAPFMGAAAAWAATQAPAITLATFAAIGVGMAVPYLVLSANPKLLKRLPRAGRGSEVLKQVMGLFILAVAAFFIGIGISSLTAEPGQPASLVYWWVVAALVLAASAWAVVQVFRISGKAGTRVLVAVPALLIAGGSVLAATRLTDRGPIAWAYYTPEKFDKARAAGDVIVLDFTADWCLNCKALEAAVLHQPEITRLLNSAGVTPIKVDLTGDNPPGRDKLKSLDWVGIPLLAVFGPGLEQPVKLDAYTPEQVKDAIARAGKRGL